MNVEIEGLYILGMQDQYQSYKPLFYISNSVGYVLYDDIPPV